MGFRPPPQNLEIFHHWFWMGLHCPRHHWCAILGFLLGSQLLFKSQKRAFVQIHLVHHLHPYLDQEALRIVIHALITLYLHYCNVLYGANFEKSHEAYH